MVSVGALCREGSDHLALSQTRYTYDRQRLNAGSSELWAIPVCAKAGTEKCELLSAREGSLVVPGCGPVYANAGARGYYRTALDKEGFRKVADSAETTLTPVERLMFLNDAWASVRVDRRDIGAFLALAQALRNDRSRSLMQLLNGDLQYIGQYLVTAADADSYRRWLRNLFEPVMQEIGWTPGPHDSEELRSVRGEILKTLGVTARDPRAIAEARAIVDKDLGGEPVDPVLVSPALAVAAREGDAALFDAIQARVKDAPSPEDHMRYLAALGYFIQPALVQRFLELGLSSQVRTQDAPYVFGRILLNLEVREQAWSFIREHWPQVESKLTTFNADWVVKATGVFCDARSREEVKTFFTQHNTPAAELALRQSLEMIDNCIDLKDQQSPKLASWLERGGNQAGD